MQALVDKMLATTVVASIIHVCVSDDGARTVQYGIRFSTATACFSYISASHLVREVS